MEKNKEISIFSKRFKQAREHKRLTQQQLANKLNTTKAMISKYETLIEGSEQLPKLYTITRIVPILEVSIDWLCGYSENPNLNKNGTQEITNNIATTLYTLADIVEGKNDFFEAKLNLLEVSEYEVNGIPKLDKGNAYSAAIVLNGYNFEHFIYDYRKILATIADLKLDDERAWEMKKIIINKHIQVFDDIKKNANEDAPGDEVIDL